MTTTPRTLKLAQLRHGHDPLAGKSLNARVQGRLSGIEEMASMLSSQTQLERLIVVLNPSKSKEAEGLYFVVNGNRRLAAMLKYWRPDSLVHVDIYDDVERALEASIATNTTRPMHPVDRFRAYAEVLVRENIDATTLARRFGIPTKEMEKSLALARVADPILDAWVADEISQAAVAVYTLAGSKDDQLAIFNSAKKRGSGVGDPRTIRAAILGKRHDASAEVNFIGLDAYRTAGGKLTEDLFGGRHVIHDPALASKLAREKLDKECADLIKRGWSWAERADAMPKGWDTEVTGYERIKIPTGTVLTLTAAESAALKALRASEATFESPFEYRRELKAEESVPLANEYSESNRKKSGCVLSYTDAGRLMIEPGVIRPEPKKVPDAEKKPAAKAQPVAKQISAALTRVLSVMLTEALASVIRDDHNSTLVARLLTASFEAGDNTCIVVGGRNTDRAALTLSAALRKVAKAEERDLLAGPLCEVVASSISLRTSDPLRVLTGRSDHLDKDAEALLDCVPENLLQASIRKRFVPTEYFDNAPAAMALDALHDIGIDPPKDLKRGELATLAAEEARQTGWLPPQIRTKGYEGPKAKSPRKSA